MSKSIFPSLVAEELSRAIKKNEPFNSAHEAYAVLLEEVDELWDEIKKKPKERDKGKMATEVTQVAAMAQRLFDDLSLEEAV